MTSLDCDGGLMTLETSKPLIAPLELWQGCATAPYHPAWRVGPEHYRSPRHSYPPTIINVQEASSKW